VKLDLLIFGGGIAGLWTLLRARAAGHSALLLESRALGGVQSIASQGIIHGGTKYALGGRLSEAARAIGEMPGRWRACLAGKGELDLAGVRLLSSHQYLWSPGGVASALAGFFASRAMRSRVTQVSAGELPPPFDDPGFRGRLYRLDEPVLDTASLLGELARQAQAWCRRYDPATLVAGRNGIEVEGVALQPRRILLAAGAGNEALLRTFGRSAPAMQRRPLHMVMARGPLPQLFAHALAASSNPRITVTSYPMAEERVWYLGGDLAERGVALSPEAQIRRAKEELGTLLPWLDLNRLRWSTLRIDRAEVATADGTRPDGPFVGTDDDLLVTWPTKLAFAPRVADQVLEALGGPEHGGIEVATGLPAPPLATLPWEETTWS